MDEIIDTTSTRFDDVVRDVDLVFDTLDRERLERSPSVICRGGRLISVVAEPPKERASELGIEIAKLVEAGLPQPAVSEVFPLSNARKAFEHSLVHHGAGRTILQVVDE